MAIELTEEELLIIKQRSQQLPQSYSETKEIFLFASYAGINIIITDFLLTKGFNPLWLIKTWQVLSFSKKERDGSLASIVEHFLRN